MTTTTSTPTVIDITDRPAGDATEAMRRYADQRLFRDSDTWEMSSRPYHRSLRPQALGTVDLGRPLRHENVTDYESLAAQRVLTCVYEQDLVFLPRTPYEGWRRDHDDFYSDTSREVAGQFRSMLEKYCFGYLADEIEVSNEWTRESFLEYLDAEFDPSAELPTWRRTIEQSVDPARAAKMWLIQFAPDFLSESSPMMKNVLGSFGPIQSDWFTILIDEYGYGVHAKKHSTLFERTLESVGLNAEPHYYWQYYLATALAANNFFHYLGSEHRHLFRYVGALVHTETTLVDFCRHAVETLRGVFGEECDVEYFAEHCHIDEHHGRMALQKVCLPMIDQYGLEVIPDMVRGIEEYKRTVSDFEKQFAMQIEWMDQQPQMRALHRKVVDKVMAARDVPVAHLDEHFNELSNSHCHNQDELCHIDDGQMFFFSGFDSSLVLDPGDGVVIRGRRQHGADIMSTSCKYRIFTIGDVDSWL